MNREQYILKLEALKSYINDLEDSFLKRRKTPATDGLDLLIKKFSVNSAKKKGIEDILQKYRKIIDDLNYDYPFLYKDLSEKPDYSILNHEIDYLIKIFTGMPETPEIKLKKEGIFLNDEDFDAFMFIGEIISDANEHIRLIDNFINEEVLTILSSKKSKDVEIKIITSNRSNKDFLKIAKTKFDKQYRNIQIKISENFHDRFIFIDKNFLYHLGCSIKDVGYKVFMFSRIEDLEIKQLLEEKWVKEWDRSNNVI